MSTFASLNVHIVFSTKSREPHIMPTWRERFHAFMGGTIKGLGGSALAIGGPHDHVHLLIGLKPNHNVSDLVREIKKASNRWVHDKIRMAAFAWQEGYGAFSVSPGNVESVTHYILNQVEHHRVKSFREEFETMLQKAGISYDPAYLE